MGIALLLLAAAMLLVMNFWHHAREQRLRCEILRQVRRRQKILHLSLGVIMLMLLPGCCARPPDMPRHIVVPGPPGFGPRVMHYEPGLIARDHGCDSHSQLDFHHPACPTPPPTVAPP